MDICGTAAGPWNAYDGGDEGNPGGSWACVWTRCGDASAGRGGNEYRADGYRGAAGRREWNRQRGVCEVDPPAFWCAWSGAEENQLRDGCRTVASTSARMFAERK